MPHVYMRPGAMADALAASGQPSRDRLARAAGLTPSTLSRIDTGHMTPSASVIAGLINVTGERFEALFDTRPPTPED